MDFGGQKDWDALWDDADDWEEEIKKQEMEKEGKKKLEMEKEENKKEAEKKRKEKVDVLTQMIMEEMEEMEKAEKEKEVEKQKNEELKKLEKEREQKQEKEEDKKKKEEEDKKKKEQLKKEKKREKRKQKKLETREESIREMYLDVVETSLQLHLDAIETSLQLWLNVDDAIYKAIEKWILKLQSKKKKEINVAAGEFERDVAAPDQDPPLIVKGYKILTHHGYFYNGVVTKGYSRRSLISLTDNQLKNLENQEEAIRRSFIPYNTSQFEKVKKTIEYLANVDHRYLTIKESVICEIDDKLCPLLVVEEVLSIQDYLKNNFETFQKVEAGLKTEDKCLQVSRWWDNISSTFIALFSDLIHSLLHIYHDLKSPIGNLRESVFVTKQGEKVKLLPLRLMNDSNTFSDDISKLCEMMKSVIDKSEVENLVTSGVKHFLEFASMTKNVKFVHCSIIDHPVFWSSRKRINFIRKILTMYKNTISLHSFLDSQLSNEFRTKDLQYHHWSAHISNNVLLEIFNKPKAPGSNISKYNDGIDIVRFHNAVYSYYNEPEYKWCRSKELSTDEVDNILRETFPDLCIQLKTIIFYYVTGVYSVGPKLEDLELEEFFRYSVVPDSDGLALLQSLYSFNE